MVCLCPQQLQLIKIQPLLYRLKKGQEHQVQGKDLEEGQRQTVQNVRDHDLNYLTLFVYLDVTFANQSFCS